MSVGVNTMSKGNPKLSVRFTREVIARIPKPQAEFLRSAVLAKLEGSPGSADPKKDALLRCLVGIFIEAGLTVEIPDDLMPMFMKIVESITNG